MEILLSHQQRALWSISIDDFYLTYDDRQRLRQRDPRLIWRGPPGTHDVPLAIETLDQLRHQSPNYDFKIPRFDKSLHNGQGDRAKWEPMIPEIYDVVWFEGWLVGCEPVDDAVFDGPLPEPIFSEGDRQFARDCNQRLGDYVPLWERLDQWAVLVPEKYQGSKRWRQQAERSRIAAGKKGLSEAEIGNFVDYFWRALHPDLFVTPWLKGEENPVNATKRSPHCIVEILGDRAVGGIRTF